MKTKIDIRKAQRLSRQLTAELQRLEHQANDEPACAAGEASDELTQIRAARDYAEASAERLFEMEAVA